MRSDCQEDPSAISKRIADLEEQLGYPLIERDRRLVRLTTCGVKLVQPVLAGDYALGLCAGACSKYSELKILMLLDEPVVLIPAGLISIPLKASNPLASTQAY